MSKQSGGNLTNCDALHRELHDGLCQSITCSLFYAQNLRSRLQKSESLDESVLNLADKAVEAATNAATDLRAILKKLASEQKPEANGL